jgi:hypothetical protein
MVRQSAAMQRTIGSVAIILLRQIVAKMTAVSRARADLFTKHKTFVTSVGMMYQEEIRNM